MIKRAPLTAQFFFFRILPLLAHCGLIYFCSSQEEASLKPFYLFPGQDKILHLIEYSILGLLLMRCFVFWENDLFSGMAAVFVGTLYGMSDEYHQSFVPGRHTSIEDLFADFAGVTLAALFYHVILSKKSRRSHFLSIFF